MWFRPPKNRRNDRGRLLDVKLRANHVRKRRIRLAGLTLAFCTALSLAGFLLWKGGGYAIDQLIYSNPAFAIERIVVETDGDLPADLIQRWAGIARGDNLMSLDLSGVQRRLMLVPCIQSAAVVRRPPSEIQLRVSERVPIAQVCLYRATGPDQTLESSALYLDADGFVMPRLAATAARAATNGPRALPSLVGLQPSDAPVGGRVALPQARAALAWAVEFSKSPLAGVIEVRTIDVSSPQCLLVTTGQGSEICFSPQNLSLQLQRWQTVHEWAAQNLKVIGTLDLAVQNYVPLRWLEGAESASPVKTKLNPPQPPRKKNV